MDEHRLLERLALGVQRPVGGARLPFVVAVHRDQAALLGEQALERRLLGERLRAGVDHLRADLAVLGPARDQSPVERLDPHDAVGPGDDAVDVLRRRDVEVLAEGLDVGLGAEVRRRSVRGSQWRRSGRTCDDASDGYDGLGVRPERRRGRARRSCVGRSCRTPGRRRRPSSTRTARSGPSCLPGAGSRRRT